MTITVCVSALRLLTRGKEIVYCVNMCPPHRTGPQREQKDYKLVSVSPDRTSVVNHEHIVQGQPQRKGVCPAIVRQCQSLKYVNNVICVDQLCSVKLAPNVAQNQPVGARLNQFWEDLEAGPKVVQMLKEGYTLPFQTRPNLTRSPIIVCCYIHPCRNLYLLEALHQLTNKNAVELVKNQESLGFYNRLKPTTETYTRSEQSQQIRQGRKIQSGDTRNDPDLLTDGSG